MQRTLFHLSLALAACCSGLALAGANTDYKIGNETFEGYLATPKGKPKGLVIVIHDWDGLDAYEYKRSDMLADNGYTAFAVDLYGKGNRPKEMQKRKDETAKLYENRDRMRSLILGGLAAARKEGGHLPAVVMGYCFGGAATLELARSGKADNIKGYATFHGGLETPKGQAWPKNTPPILIAHGGADTGIPMSQVAALAEELEAAKVPYEIEVYSGAPHAFTVIGSDRYQEKADKKSWAAFLDFLGDQL
jgi:dienelactone hydrolase